MSDPTTRPGLDLRHGSQRVFAHVLVSSLAVSVANFTVWFAVTFWIYLETRSVFATGLIAGIFLVATASTGIWFGSIVDHHRKQTVIQMSAVVSANTWLGLGEQFTFSATGLPDRDFIGNDPTRRYLSGQLALPIGTDGWRIEIIGTHGTTVPRVNQTAATRGTLDQWRMRLAYDVIKSRDLELTFAARFDATDEKLDTTALSPATPLSVDRVRPVRIASV